MCGHFIPISIAITKLLWINVIYGQLTMFSHAFKQTLLNITRGYLQELYVNHYLKEMHKSKFRNLDFKTHYLSKFV